MSVNNGAYEQALDKIEALQKHITKLEVALKDMKNVAKTCAATLIVFGAITVSTGVVRLIPIIKHWMMR